MLFVNTIFDPNRDSRPLVTGIYDDQVKSLKFFDLYLHKTGRTIYDIEQDIKLISGVIKGADIVHLNDCKQHLIAFGIGTADNTIYDHPICSTISENNKKTIAAGIANMKKEGEKVWMKLRANASFAYRNMQNRGILFGYKRTYPTWYLDTYSGRSRTVGFASQGLQEGAPVANINGDTIFIQLDWISADFRAAALLSGDKLLESSFKNSDPYTFLADYVNKNTDDQPLVRDEAKLALLQSLYSMDVENLTMSVYTELRDWMIACKERLQTVGYVESLLGRQFSFGGDRSILSAFNGSIQGTVAHGMQSCIYTVYGMFPDKILIENHDSLVMTAKNADEAKEIIRYVKPVMMHPFDGIVEGNPVFPIEIGVGKVFKQWKSKRIYE